ncbi:MAG: membrane protein insertase YidC [Candidatus Omnitrophica bacterium]|nr:membrane protein insertase YidC [Candidatus Omnitrophota bacterium]
MNSEKRLLLAVALSFLILILYPIYLKWVSPPPAQVPEAEQPVPAKLSTEMSSTVGDIQQTISQAEPLIKETRYELSKPNFEVEFTNLGGAVTKVLLKSWGKVQNGDIVLIDRKLGRAGAFLTNLTGQGVDFNSKIFSLELLDQAKGEIRLASEEAGKWRMVKTYKLHEERPALSLEVEIHNLSDTQLISPLEVTSRLDLEAHPQNDPVHPESFVATDEKLVSRHLNKIEKQPYVVEGKISWQALARKYFTVIIRSDEPAVLAKTAAGTEEETKFMRSTLQWGPIEVPAAGVVNRNFLIYAGPQYYRDLKSYSYGFEQILSHGFFGTFRFWLLIAIQWAHKTVGNYGWAIILITFALKLLFTPLTHMSFESMKKMQALQPKMKALQEQHKGDQARLSQEMMGLYKKHKVNPMGGCLPMVLQIPVFIAFYQVLSQTAELKGEPFIFWIKDLSEVDRAWTLPFSLPFLGDAVNVLPLLMLGSMVWQQRLTPATGTPEQQKMMMFMPIIFGFVFYSLPSGLVLYWFVNNILSIFHQLFIKGKALPHHEE